MNGNKACILALLAILFVSYVESTFLFGGFAKIVENVRCNLHKVAERYPLWYRPYVQHFGDPCQNVGNQYNTLNNNNQYNGNGDPTVHTNQEDVTHIAPTVTYTDYPDIDIRMGI